MTGREIKDTLDRAGVLPSKQLGQNFLIDPNMARWIVAQLEATANDAIVEVGPGTGALSEHLVGKVRRLILIEFDARLAAVLAERFGGEPTVEVHAADGAKFDGRTLFKHRPLKFLGNLPYASGGAILKNLLSRPHPFERAVVMLQKEVVDRICAAPGSKKYGRLSVMMQYYCATELLFDVPPESFDPAPKVMSAIVRLIPHQQPPVAVNNLKMLNRVVVQAFSQRRKTLRNSLKKLIDEDAIVALGIDPNLRAEVISLPDFARLSNLLREEDLTEEDADLDLNGD